jgi:hypothetical protein
MLRCPKVGGSKEPGKTALNIVLNIRKKYFFVEDPFANFI